MPNHPPNYQILPISRDRQLVADAGWLAHRKHMMHGLIEIDVTAPRQLIHAEKARTGEGLSFTAFALACIGAAVEVDRTVQAYRDWRNRLIIFNDVDVIITIEIERHGAPFPLVHMVRAVNQRSARVIHAEIRAVQHNPSSSAGSRFIDIFPRLPQIVRRSLYLLLDRRPDLRKQYMGTVGFTSVGMMFGARSGWGIGAPSHSLAITFGSITPKPVMVGQQVEMREILNATISFDHDIIDGAPATRFAQRFATLLESGHGLEPGPA